jgi:methylenetetrahydrofolate dehydrogenase (NADP+)/methenyltetrahydrofolate cyclohydrolase
MPATLIDGKAIAERLRGEVARGVTDFVAATGRRPGLAVVLVGENPASQVYVRNKARQTVEVGMASMEHTLPATTSQADVLALVAQLNARADVDGILVQLPLPAHIDAGEVLRSIDPEKDVDGFHPLNVGRLAIGEDALTPCTPLGSLILARGVLPLLAGVDAMVIGRSTIVGKPMAQLLLQADATVTIAHSKTRDLRALVARADLVIAAVGRPEMVRGDWLKPGAVVIDVGINRIDAGGGKTRLVGDCHFESCSAVASAITPVPGGVGPMTIACLLQNTLTAARRRLRA